MRFFVPFAFSMTLIAFPLFCYMSLCLPVGSPESRRRGRGGAERERGRSEVGMEGGEMHPCVG